MKSKSLIYGAVTLVVIFSSFSVFAQDIPIGFFAPLTGFGAADGASAKHSVDIAVKNVNDAGGIKGRKINLIFYDDRTDSKEAVAIVSKLIEKDQVVAVVSGSYSMPSRVAAPILQKAKIPMVVGYATHQDITKAGDYIFRWGCLGLVEGGVGAEVAIKLLKAKRIAALSMDNDAGRGLYAGFSARAEKLGQPIVFNQVFKIGEKDFTPYLTKVKELNPDILFVNALYGEGALVCRQARALGIKTQIIGHEGMDSPKFIEIAGEAAEGVIITTNLNRDDPRPLVQNFFKIYKQNCGIDADMVGASTYDAFMVVVKAIEKAGTKPEAIRKALAETRDYQGLTGRLSGFNEIGESMKPIQVQVVKGGKFRYFAEITDPEIITPPSK
jgi:branched-chain amino acid transport system substrate-binding protein